MNNSSPPVGGIGFVGLLTIVFITLKLTGYIDWTWTWVLAPIWISIIAFFVIIMIILALVASSHRNGKNPFN